MAFDITQYLKKKNGTTNTLLAKKPTVIPQLQPLSNIDKEVGVGDVATGQGMLYQGTPIQAQSPVVDNTQGLTYKALSTLENAPDAMTNFSKTVQPALQTFKGWADNNAPGLDIAKQSGQFADTKKVDEIVTDLYNNIPNATPELVAETMKQMGDEGYIFEGINDKSSYSPLLDVPYIGNVIKGGGQVLGAGAGMLSALAGIPAGEANLMRGSQNISEGNLNLGASQVLEGTTEGGMGLLTGAFPVISTLFNTKAVQDSPVGSVFEGIGEGANAVTKYGLDLTGMDPNSEEYKNYERAGTDALAFLTTYGAFKGGQKAYKGTFGENLNYNNATVGDFVKPSGKTVQDFESAVAQAMPGKVGKFTEGTKLSDIFTPEQYAQIDAIAKNSGNPMRREGIISDATQAKAGQYVKDAFGNIVSKLTPKKGTPEQPKAKTTVPPEEGNAVNSEGTVYTQENVPSKASGLYKKVMTGGDNEGLASRAVTPSTVKKTTKQKVNAGAIALAGLQRLHNDATNGNIDADISTMEGGVEGIQQALQYHGARIGELTGVNGNFDLQTELRQLQSDMDKRGASISPDLNAITNSILKDFAQFGPNITISEAQQVLSTIKSNIFSDPAKIKQLAGTISGSALDTFLKSFEAKFKQTIDDIEGTSRELADAKKSYSELKAIQNDITNSYVVELRNQAKRGGLSNQMGNVAALMQLLKNPSLSSMATAAIMKTVATEIGKGKTRNAAYERLMENFKTEDIERAQGKRPRPEKKVLGNKFETDLNKVERNKKLPPASEEALTKEKTAQPDITPESKVTRPTSKSKEELQAEREQYVAEKRAKEIKYIKEDIAGKVKAARYGGVGETRVQSAIETLLTQKKITIEEAKQIVEDIMDSVTAGESTYPYVTKKGIEEYLEKLYSANYKIDGGDLFKTPKKGIDNKPEENTTEKEVVKPKPTKEGLQKKVDIAKGKLKPKPQPIAKLSDAIDQATELGKKAAIEGKSLAPAQHKEMWDLWKQIPEDSIPKVTKAFVEGYNNNVPETDWEALGMPEVLTSKDGVQYKVREGSMGIQKKDDNSRWIDYQNKNFPNLIKDGILLDRNTTGDLNVKIKQNDFNAFPEQTKIDVLKIMNELDTLNLTYPERLQRVERFNNAMKWNKRDKKIALQKKEPKKNELSYGGMSVEVAMNPKLSPDELKVQQDMLDDVRDNIGKYMEKWDKEYGNNVSADEGKHLSKYFESIEGASKYSNATHKVASAFARLRYKYLLSKNKTSPVLFMAGGSGVGKTTTLKAGGHNLDDYAVVYDTNLNSNGGLEKIQQAIDNGNPVEVAYIYRDIFDAFENGVLPRAEKTGRIVPIEAHIGTHKGSYDKIVELTNKYSDSKVKLSYLDNSRGKGNSQMVTFDELQNLVNFPPDIENKLIAILDKSYKEGKISKRVYDGFDIPGKMDIMESGKTLTQKTSGEQTGGQKLSITKKITESPDNPALFRAKVMMAKQKFRNASNRLKNGQESTNTLTVGSKEGGTSGAISRKEVIREEGGNGKSELGNGSSRTTAISKKGGELGQNRSPIGKKGRAEINTKSKEILESKNYSMNASDYSKEEKDILRQYTGAGGKASEGATGRGLLDEYYTPKDIVQSMWDIVTKKTEGKTGLDVFEPTVGVGRFIENAPEGHNIFGMELDKTSGTIAKILNSNADIKIGDFQSLFMDDKGRKVSLQRKYDVIIGNPPYGPRGGLFRGLGEEKSIGKQEDYFIKRGIDLLKQDGILTFIVPSGFLKTGWNKTKDAIAMSGGKLIDAYRLPEGMFEDTTIGTDILVFQKGDKGNLLELSDDKFFSNNPDNILGTTLTRTNKFGKEEQYVSGDKTTAIAKLQEGKVSTPKEAPKAGLAPKAEKQQQMTLGDVVPEETPVVKQEVKTEAQKPVIQRKQSPKKRAEESKEVTVSGIKTEQYQIVNGEDADAIDIDIYTSTKNNGVVEYRKEWDDRINYYNGEYIPDILYFSGDTYSKLEQLEADRDNISAERYKRQRAGLEAIKPKEKTILDINFDPLSRDYLNIKTGERRKTWTRTEGNTEIDANVNDLFNKWLNEYPRNLIARGVYKGDITGYIAGERQRNGTKEITGEIHSEARRLYNIFMKNNLPKEAQDMIVSKYNREKNSYVAPEYNKIPVVIQGMATEYLGRKFDLSDTQQAGLGFLTTKRVGLVAYGVGVGKTHTLLVSTVVNMQKGNTKRPVFFVPGSTLQKTWIDTAKAMFPGVPIKNLSGLTSPEVAKLKKQYGEDPKNWIKDGEITFMTHKGILKLGFTPEEIQEITGELTDVIGDFDNKTDRAVQIEIGKMEAETGKALRHSTDINFTDLGFDHISVDEVHNFRKVFTEAKVEGADEDGEGGRRRFGKLDTGGTPSLQARKLFILTQMVQKATGGNVFLASATPFENKATEIYNILSFMARDRLKELSIFNLNDFISQFADLKTEFTYKMNGDVQDKEIMKSFANKQELHRLMQEFIDFQEDPTLVRPEKVILTPQLRMSPKQEIVKAKIDELLQGVTRDAGGAISAGEKALGAELKASTYGKSYSISPFYVSEFMAPPKNAEEFVKESPKIEYAMEMARALKNHPIAKNKGIFMYIGKEGVGFTDMFVDYLVNNIGYTKDQIGVIKGGIKDEEKELIKEKYNDGRIKVLIGGDNTKEGIDLQNNGYVTINLALGWNPTEMMQVSGRQWRQGNALDKVLEIYPLVENSSDIGIFQKVEEKASRMKDSFSYAGTESFDIGDIDPMEQKLILVTDPVKKAALASRIENKQLEQERVYKEGEMEDLKAMKTKRETLERMVPNLERSLEQLTPDTWQYSEAKVKNYKDEIAKTKRDIKNIEEKLQVREIKSIDDEVAKIQKEIDEIEQKKKDLKENEGVLIEKYTKEYLENLKNTKTMDNHISEINSYADKIKIYTPDELAAKKEALKQKLLTSKLGKKNLNITSKIDTEQVFEDKEPVIQEPIVEAPKKSILDSLDEEGYRKYQDLLDMGYSESSAIQYLRDNDYLPQRKLTRK